MDQRSQSEAPSTRTTAACSTPLPPKPPGLKQVPAPPLRKSPHSAPDAPDDSTLTHAPHGLAAHQSVLTLDADPLLPTTGTQQPPTTPFEGLSMSLKPWWPKLAPHFRSGVLGFVVGRNDDKPYLLRRGSGNACLIEINRQSTAMHELLRLCVSSEGGDGPTKRNVEEAIDVLASYAQEYGQRMDTFYRVAPHPDGGVAIDLGDTARTQVWIKPGHVEIVTRGSSLPIRRSKSMQALSTPADIGEINRLNQYVKVDPMNLVVIKAWITYTIAHPKQDASKYVILVLQGGEGSGKTSLSKILQRLIDPTAMGVRAFPRNVQDLALATQASHLVIFDNIRSISPQMSDALCMSSTGGSLSTRKLYTDDGQANLSLHGAVILNGIHAQIDQPDLAQRCLPIRLKPMSHQDRLPDGVLAAQFEADLPYIMRGLYDLIAKILTHLPSAKATLPTRMMGFSHWLAAMEKALGAPTEAFQDVYQDAISEAQLDAVMDNPVGEAVLDLLARESTGVWSGTPTALLDELEGITDRRVLRTRDWPSNPIALSKRLQTLQVALSAQGISVQTSRGKSRQITLKTIEAKS